jgi:nucleoside-diphosphate-sugar epimerase
MEDAIIDKNRTILVTGAGGFIGSRVVACLLERGFQKVRCLIKPGSEAVRLMKIAEQHQGASIIEIIRGNLLDPNDCATAVKGAFVIYHLAAGMGLKSFPDAFLNSAVTTRNLLASSLKEDNLRRFVNVSSFAVYTNRNKPHSRIFDESCPVETHPESRAEAYCFGKVKQDKLVEEYGKVYKVPYVLVRPGNVFGPGKDFIPGRVGIDPFGLYLNFGGSNPLPLTYVDNCADAIVLAGLVPRIEGEAFNVVDDDLPTCSRYLRLYKQNIKPLRSFFVPHFVSYLFCFAWEKLSGWSKGQLPPVYTRREWVATWKRTRYSNQKLKSRLGWIPGVPMQEALDWVFNKRNS